MSGAKVLLVEDDPDLVETYHTYLQDRFDVRSVTDGRKALKIIDNSVDVVLLDRRMPDMDGDEVLETMRDRGHEMPVAMVTAVDPGADIVELPFDQYLLKPVDQDELIDTVNILIARSSFESTSRRFFQLISKKNSLEKHPGKWEMHEYEQLLTELAKTREELSSTIGDLSRAGEKFQSRFVPDTEEAERLLMNVFNHSLPDVLSELIEEYQRLESARPPFMWKWVHRLAPQNQLPCVDDEYENTVAIDKTLIVLFITLLDDSLEKHSDRATFDELSKIPSRHAGPGRSAQGASNGSQEGEMSDRSQTHPADVNTEYIDFGYKVWKTLYERIREAPNYGSYINLFHYDIEQAISGVKYSDIAIQRPDLSTMGDLERYESQNMAMLPYSDVDLMYSPLDVRDDLSSLRDAIWKAQKMARIGNWVSTWERELREGDYSSGPVVYALEKDIISHEELQNGLTEPEAPDDIVERLKQHSVEDEFLMRWEQHHYELQSYSEEISTMDLEPFIDGTREILRYHLATTGLK